MSPPDRTVVVAGPVLYRFAQKPRGFRTLPSTPFNTFLRAGQEKPGFLPRIRDEFRQNARIPKTDVMHIEYLYRRAQRQLDQLKDVNTKQLGTFQKPRMES
ncbi:hypothetical protein JZ751_006434 [Albula glossodonta]|uniref:Complex 1 LYR protein domain-containing protein n=1 Tax=Albula glossodonta TaxID=121402 RepID=A0A8T2MQ19_9TELE|nr:hypothetical protein JZ751_016162 [Albula glossodonta]KAG9329240.1 hypothetical protein JZ751_006434 [Albula glossodonta]